MPSITTLPTWTSCRACPRNESKFGPKEFGYVVLIEVSFYQNYQNPNPALTGEASVGRKGRFTLRIYINKNIR